MRRRRPRVHLLYIAGCPHVDAARRNLKRAFAALGREPVWTELDVRSPRTPRGWRGFPSPTVLVDGRDVRDGRRRARGAPACRIDGAPPARVLAEKLAAGGPRTVQRKDKP